MVDETRSPPTSIGVTLSGRPTEELIARARAAAKRWGIPYFPRGRKQSLLSMLEANAAALLVFGHDGVTLTDPEGTLAFHAGIAHLRLMRLEAGEGDTLIRVADVREGDTIIDCTLGLAQDAMVLARAAGPSGRVIGIEKSFPLFAVVDEGLREFERGSKAGPIELRNVDAAQFLRAQPARSADLVFFDPMFSFPKKSQPAFEVLRRYAEHAPLTPELLGEAKRVARRAVVVKSGRGSRDLVQLGLLPTPTSRHSDLAFAVIPTSA